jgi:hypothetical protein
MGWGFILVTPGSVTTKPTVISVKHSNQGKSKFIVRLLAKLGSACGQHITDP